MGWVLILFSVALAGVTVLVGVQKPPNALATGLLQGITLVFSTVGSYLLGQASAKDAAKEVLRPHARSAFRRMRSLYLALGRLQNEIGVQSDRILGLANPTSNLVKYEYVRGSLVTLDQLVLEQIATADDALADWRDIVPEEVKQIEDEARQRMIGTNNE